MTSAIALFNDATSDDFSIVNPLRDLSRRRTKGRAEMEHVLTPAEVARLRGCALASAPGKYGRVMEAMVEVMATTAPRPGELWTMAWARFDPDDGCIDIKYAVKKDGKLGPPKYEQERPVVLAPSAVELIERLERRGRFIFPTKTGR